MSRYAAEIDLGNPNDSHTQLIELVGRDKAVLDVGCATGEMARTLVGLGCRVSGVDMDASAAEAIAPVLEELVIADLDDAPLSTHFKPESFDAIIFGDVLEHLRDPGKVLKDAVPLLAPGGRILVSIPNIAHGSVRLALLQGRWVYTPTGLLDATHLRFFTRDGVCELLEDAGLVIEELRSTVLDPLATEVEVDAARLPDTVIEWVRHQPDSLNYQYVAAARALQTGETRGQRPALEPALPLLDVRVEDEHTERMRREQDERHRMLTIRDHIIGLEASVASADARAARANTRARYADRRAKRMREQLDTLIADIERLAQAGASKRAIRQLVEELKARPDSDE